MFPFLQFVSDDPVDYMDQPPAGLAIQGVLRPAFVEDSSVLNKYMDSQFNDEEANQNSEDNEEELGVINGHRHEDDQDVEEGLQKDEVSGNGTSYYKLDIVKIHLISAHGNQVFFVHLFYCYIRNYRIWTHTEYNQSPTDFS